MIDLREHIPTWAIINHLILERAVHTNEYRQCVGRVEETLQLRQGALAGKYINSAHTVSLLYCLIVVPKEVWLPQPDHSIYAAIAGKRLHDLFTFEVVNDRFHEHPAYYLIHHLRNAVAHAHFWLNDVQVLCFWDQKTQTSPPHFRASTSLDRLGQFLAEIGKMFDNLRLGRQMAGT